MEHLKQETVSGAQLNQDALYQICPQCFIESKDPKTGDIKHTVDFDKLRLLLGDNVAEGDERYDFTWVGKRAALLEAAKPIRKTLRPCPEESVDWENTKNLYIEGDNLDVLKLLQNSYMGKVKMIYIDPPYNTGNDFVYHDDFHQTKQDYDLFAGDVNEEGERYVKNTETNGRFHSDWCSMMYSRLMIARSMLSEDGVIFISIDDNEVNNIRKICDEIIGEHNFIACLVYDKNRKNDAKFFSVGHEYMLVYFKNFAYYQQNGIIFREPKEGVEEVYNEFNRLRKKYSNNWILVNEGLKKLYSSWSNDDERKPLARFTKVDEKGPYRDDGNISWPGGGGPKYDVIHPITGKPCKCPDAGWRFPTPERMKEEIDNGRVVFGEDETTLPRIRRNLFEYDKQVMRSVHFSYAQTATLEFNKIFDGLRIFENPKSITDLRDLIRYVIPDPKEDIILDFFSGSATTAHAVMLLNSIDNGNRKFIMVQLPEATEEKSEAYKAGYKNICEIGKERIRRAGKQIQKEQNDKQRDLFSGEPKKLDVGFRVLKCTDSNMKDVYYAPADYSQQMLFGLEDNIKENRNDLDLLFGCMLDWGVTLDLPLRTEKVDGVNIHVVNEGDLVACFEKHIPESVIDHIASLLPMRVVLRDSCFDEAKDKMNFFEIFKQRTGWSEEEVRKNVKVI